jgi:hypothetical protein
MTPAGRTSYSFIRHLAWAIWLNHDPKRCIVTALIPFLAAYDASGSENDRDGVLVVVALAATEDKWLKFENSWRGVLKDFDVPYLRMTELNHRHSGTGVYAKWKDDDVVPRLFLKALIKALKRGINKTFCYGTVLSDYREINKRFKLRERSGSPYALTAASCHDQVNAWMRRRYPKHAMIHVFEQGDCGQRDLNRLAKRQNQRVISLPKIDPVTGERWLPFQGADLVAGAYRNAANKREMVQTYEDYGEVFNELAKTLPQRSLVHHKETLLALCLANPDKYPKRA